MKRWDIISTGFPGGDIEALLADGWEPFAASVVPGMAARTPEGAQVPVQLVTLRRLRSEVEVSGLDLGRFTRPVQ